MEQKINIAEILKDAPYKTKLWSPICGDCYLLGVEKDMDAFEYPITITRNSKDWSMQPLKFTRDGKLYKSGECLLFPTKNCRSWEDFQAPWKHKHFEPFRPVLVAGTTEGNYWFAALYSHYDEKQMLHMLVGGGAYADKYILPYEGNEDKLGKEVENEV